MLYIVTDLLPGGPLLDALLAQGDEAYSEADARTAFTALLRGLNYLHARGVTHRDVKLDNLLLAVPGDLSSVRIVDFGLAAACFEDDPADEPGMRWLCGSAAYMAPEVAQRKTPYSCAADLWSAGVVLHLLLTGLMPFAAPPGAQDEDEALLHAARARGWAVRLDGPEWKHVSAPGRAFVAALLTADPATRLTATSALMHEWVCGDLAGATKLRGTLALLRRYTIANDLPTISLPVGTFLGVSCGGACGVPAASAALGPNQVYLIKKGTVDVLVADEDNGDVVPPSPACGASLAAGNSGRMRRVGSRNAGELVGELVRCLWRGPCFVWFHCWFARSDTRPPPGPACGPHRPAVVQHERGRAAAKQHAKAGRSVPEVYSRGGARPGYHALRRQRAHLHRRRHRQQRQSAA